MRMTPNGGVLHNTKSSGGSGGVGGGNSNSAGLRHAADKDKNTLATWLVQEYCDAGELRLCDTPCSKRFTFPVCRVWFGGLDGAG